MVGKEKLDEYKEDNTAWINELSDITIEVDNYVKIDEPVEYVVHLLIAISRWFMYTFTINWRELNICAARYVGPTAESAEKKEMERERENKAVETHLKQEKSMNDLRSIYCAFKKDKGVPV